MWPFKPKSQPAPIKKHKRKFDAPAKEYPSVTITPPAAPGVAMDSKFDSFGLGADQGMDYSVGAWFASQRFIGYAQAAWIAKHWLVDKAINMPVRGALKNGWEIDTDDQAVIDKLTSIDKKYLLLERLREYFASGRRTGGAVAVFLTCPELDDEAEYYEAPLNIQAVTQYHGIAVIDAADAHGELITEDMVNPASLNYMTPTFYKIGTRRYHKSHCIAFTPYPVADTLKPTYGYWGVSLPERIYERVYAAERTANEAPLLTMTKRLRTLGIDLQDLLAGDEEALAILKHNVAGLQEMANNMGVFVYDAANGSGMQQLDTALADVDTVIMTQYQLVAAIAEIPATRLLGTTPKGFNATGDAEAEDYRQHLEEVQTNDLQPLIEKHYRLACQVNDIPDVPSITWLPVDSPTAEMLADIDSKNGQTVANLANAMVITPEQGAEALSQKRESMFYGLDLKQSNEVRTDAENLLDDVMAGLNESNE